MLNVHTLENPGVDSFLNPHPTKEYSLISMSDLYYTILRPGEGQFREKMSRFIAFALPVTSASDAKDLIRSYQNKYHDARHVCWAYMLGADRKEWQLNDNGEPSGTAGKPILGQINSLELTNVVVIVVRYFGGVKLGTPGLIAAYREAARLALDDAGKKEMHSMVRAKVVFPYMAADGVMKVIKEKELCVIERVFDNSCAVVLDIREDMEPEIRGRLESLSGISYSIVED